ncbi:hypothetical protein [Achromobacter deleyi]|uniref:hypothetical protein n=1 Tax=Achromobacter deleyi TaxID=1353891 RepID=UPI00149205AF|nr:hypothetical protein [Achromobacter deleyi]QVQ27701.1 hypothetical protein HLG70_04445 [Achromobacter deleyi]UIP23301.1 hypothetical protein LYZ39_12555 [Achromobacter deleyi]
MIQATRALVFLLNVFFYVMQTAAIAAGLQVWPGWDHVWTIAAAVAVIWMIPVPLVAGISGIVGAHYGWQWSWLASIALFAGIKLLVSAIQATLLGETKPVIPRYADWRMWRSAPESAQTDPATSSGPQDHRIRFKCGVLYLALAIGGYLLITGVIRFAAPASGASSAIPATIDTKLKSGLERFRARLHSTPEFTALLSTMTPQEATIKSVELGNRGLLKLPVADLEHRANIRLRMLNAADPATCARFVHLKAEDSQRIAADTYAFLAQQSQEVIDDWLDLVYRATVASLRQHPDHRPSEQEIDASMRRVLATLPETQQQAIRLTLQKPVAATDEQLCAGLKALTSASLEAPEPDRAVLVRALSMR